MIIDHQVESIFTFVYFLNPFHMSFMTLYCSNCHSMGSVLFLKELKLSRVRMLKMGLWQPFFFNVTNRLEISLDRPSSRHRARQGKIS